MSYDNALAETVNGYYKAEADPRAGSPAGRGRPIEEVELEDFFGWVHWHDAQRLHGYLGDLPARRVRSSHAARQDPDRGVLPVARARLASPQNASHSFTPTRSRGEIDARVASRRPSGTPLPHPDRRRCRYSEDAARDRAMAD